VKNVSCRHSPQGARKKIAKGEKEGEVSPTGAQVAQKVILLICHRRGFVLPGLAEQGSGNIMAAKTMVNRHYSALST